MMLMGGMIIVSPIMGGMIIRQAPITAGATEMMIATGAPQGIATGIATEGAVDPGAAAGAMTAGVGVGVEVLTTGDDVVAAIHANVIDLGAVTILAIRGEAETQMVYRSILRRSMVRISPALPCIRPRHPPLRLPRVLR